MFLYYIFILPIIFLLEIIIHFLYPILAQNAVLAIMLISFIVNFITYPIFAKIELLCQDDNHKYQKLLPRIQSIKANFSGSEQRMLLNTYFKQNNYHPLLAHFKQSLIIFLQVPVFIASYIVISNTYLFQDATITEINEFFSIGSTTIRILPIIMTLFNIASVLIYMENRPLTAKIYSYMLAFIFLVLLYFSPASVVLFWICNNAFSLLRNVWFYRKKLFWLYVVVLGASFIFLASTVNSGNHLNYTLLILCLIALVYKYITIANKDTPHIIMILLFCTIYLVMHAIGLIMPKDSLFYWILGIFFIELIICIKKYLLDATPFQPSLKDFSLCTLLMFIVFSVYLPLKLINSDPEEFYRVIDLWKLLYAEITIGIGLFFVYPTILFYTQKQHRKLLFFLVLNLLIIFMTSLYLFKQPNDVINAFMQFGLPHSFSSFHHTMSDIFFLIMTFLLSAILFRWQVIKYINLLLIVFIFTYIVSCFNEFRYLKSQTSYIDNKTDNHLELTLSSHNKNVLIIFIDRAISGFFPIIMKEKPYLKSELSGFTYYPYTVSFAPHTLYSAPSLFGGYDYTPIKLQNDISMKMVDKHNQALNLLPESFRKSNYNVSLFGLPDINYGDKNRKLPFHKDINFIDVQNFKITREKESMNMIINNMTWFILFRISLSLFRDSLYNNGNYLSYKRTRNTNEIFATQEYNYFENLINNIKVHNAEKGRFSIFISLLPHFPIAMTKNYHFINNSKNYEPQIITKTKNYIYHYNVNMLSWIEISKLLKKLKEMKVYNNTKIIILSDHGWPINDLDLIHPRITLNNAVLLVKDFEADGELKTDTTFMTLADVPYLATYNAVIDEFNPFNMVQAIQEKQKGVDIISQHLKIWSPLHYKDKNRTYLYDEEVEYMHVDEHNIKKLIRIEVDGD